MITEPDINRWLRIFKAIFNCQTLIRLFLNKGVLCFNIHKRERKNVILLLNGLKRFFEKERKKVAWLTFFLCVNSCHLCVTIMSLSIILLSINVFSVRFGVSFELSFQNVRNVFRYLGKSKCFHFVGIIGIIIRKEYSGSCTIINLYLSI